VTDSNVYVLGVLSPAGGRCGAGFRPQGSVLGSVLFLTFSNNLDIGVFSKILKFADNTKLFSSCLEVWTLSVTGLPDGVWNSVRLSAKQCTTTRVILVTVIV